MKPDSPQQMITPQWVTIKEEILHDYYQMWDHFANWRTMPKSLSLTRAWATTLFSLFGKVREKLLSDDKYKGNVATFDLLMSGKIDYIHATRQMAELTYCLSGWIEDSGLHKVEKEYKDPYAAFELSYPG